MLMKMHWPTSDELLQQALQDRELARYVFDRQMAEYIQDRADASAAWAEFKMVPDEEGRHMIV